MTHARRRRRWATQAVRSLHRLVEDVIALTRFGEDEGEMGSDPLLIQRILPRVVASEGGAEFAFALTVMAEDDE